MVRRDTTTTVTVLKGDEEINRVETNESLLYCNECGKEIGHYNHMYGICQICEKDLCKDHAIPAPEINGGVICADCNQTYAEDIKNLKANKQATHDALVGLNKAGKVYDKIVADLIERVKASKQKKQNK